MAFTPIVSSLTVTGDSVNSETHDMVANRMANDTAVYSEDSQLVSFGGVDSISISVTGEVGKQSENIHVPGEIGCEGSPVYLITFHTWTQAGGIYLQGGGTSGINYDQYTPTEGGERTLVGCTATATAQLIYYWGYEQTLSGHSITVNAVNFSSADQYTTDSLSINIDAESTARNFLSFTQLDAKLGDIKYQFDPDEIAALSFGVGVKLQSDYGLTATGAYLSDAESLLKELGFSSAQSVFENDADGLLVSSQIDLTQELIDNIQAGRPVLTAIRDFDTGGHAIIIDGYNSGNGTFHFNMGWGGSNDGWYSLSNLPANYDIIMGIVYDPEFPDIVTMF